MPEKITTVAFDADDTLWHNERFFRSTHELFVGLLADYAPRAQLDTRLLAAERRNLGHYGFGVKGFTLSMIETAVEITGDQVPAAVIREILETGREMLNHPVELLPHARAAVEAAAADHKVMLITKGDLLHQERKLAQSGLGDLFSAVEVVSDKTPGVYARIFARHGCAVETALMAGNSMKSDVLPVIAAGGHGVYVPHGIVWELEFAEAPTGEPRFHSIGDLGGLAPLLSAITGR